MKSRESALVISQEKLAPDVYSLWLGTEKIAQEAKAGQFIALYSRDKSRMLPRPVSVCEADRERGRLRLVYRVVGQGTAEFSGLAAGEKITVLGPLGNGFPLKRNRKIFLIGGGIGIPPMLELARELDGKVQIIAGYRDELFLTKELGAHGKLYLATEDGSAGTKGNVMDAVRENHLSADLIYACGPKPMLCAVKDYAAENGIECYLSLEEKMACGIGACLACVCRTKDVDAHSHVHNKRVCKDGPVFLSTEVEL